MSARSERRRREQQALAERVDALGREHELGGLWLTLRHGRTSWREYVGCLTGIIGILLVPGTLVAAGSGQAPAAGPLRL